MVSLAVVLVASVFARQMERVASTDPVQCQSVCDSKVIQLIYETPLNIDYYARPYKLVPGACELPEVSADGLTYIFRLREKCGSRSVELGGKCESRSVELGVKDVKDFEDSTTPHSTLLAPSSYDIVRSLERLRDPKIVSPNGWYLKSVDTIKALDDKTIEIKMKRRQHVFPWIMAMSGCGIVKEDGSGTGPFELIKWWKNHEMVFRRRGIGNGELGMGNGFDEVRFLVIDDMSTQWLMFLNGELDVLGEISQDNWDAVVDKDGNLSPDLVKAGVKMYSMPTLSVMYIGLNMKDPVLGNNKKLRQALNAAFDFEAWNRFYCNRAEEAGGPLPPTVESALPAETFKYRFNLELAKKLIAEAGYPDGIDPKTGRRLVLTVSMGRASQDARERAELMASFYEKIGVKLETKFYTWDAFLKAVNEGRTQMYQMGWVGDYPDAENFLQLFHSSNVSPGANHSCYVNPEYDRAYDAAMAATTVEERDRYWRECQEIVREDCPWIYTHVPKSNSLVRPSVGNYIPSDFPYGQEAFLESKKEK